MRTNLAVEKKRMKSLSGSAGVPTKGTGESQAPHQERKPAVVRLRLDEIVIDPALQMRVKISDQVVADYADAITAGSTLPSIVVFQEGEQYLIADGVHRFKAHELLEFKDIEAEIHQGSRRDAILYAASANATHGLPRTIADKRRAVENILKDPEWSLWSSRVIAEKCAVSHTLVDKVKTELCGNGCQKPAAVKAIRAGKEITVQTKKSRNAIQDPSAESVVKMSLDQGGVVADRRNESVLAEVRRASSVLSGLLAQVQQALGYTLVDDDLRDRFFDSLNGNIELHGQSSFSRERPDQISALKS